MSLLAAYYATLNAKNIQDAAAAGEDARTRSMAQQDSSATQVAQRGLLAAQAGAAQAGAQRTAADTGQVAANAASARGLDAARTTQTVAGIGSQQQLQQSEVGLNNARAADANAAARLNTLPGLGGGSALGALPDFSAFPNRSNADGTEVQGDETGGVILKKGEVAQGKAKKPGPTDTVPAMLTPGEAVLNKGAVAHYGSDVVDHMNKMGLLRMGAQSEVAKAMGQPDPHAPPPKGKGGKSKGGGKGPMGFSTGGVVPTIIAPVAAPAPTPLATLGGYVPVASPAPAAPLAGHLGLVRALMGGGV